MKLNLGAGMNQKSPEEGWVNIDIRPLKGIDLVLDLENNNLPYPDNSVDEINMQDFIEHLSYERQESFLREVYRVMKPGARMFIQTPHLRVLAERYCNILQNPTELQHPLDGNIFSKHIFAGQDYPENIHRWCYDETTLSRILESVGFVVRDIHSDGGSNMLAFMVKPYSKVLIPVGGGIGDILQIYLSNPSSRKNYEGENRPPPEEFPTSNVDASLWLKRLAHFKATYPNASVKVVVVSTNSVAKEIFEYNPYIDKVDIMKPGDAPKWYRYMDSEGYMHIEGTEFMYEKFPPDPPRFYMNEDETRLCAAAKVFGNYIVIHPFAGAVERVVLSEKIWRQIIDRLIDDLGYDVIVVGKQSVFNGHHELPEDFRYQRDGLTSLVNRISVNASAQLTLDAAGFIGTHSCMVLCAWYARIPTVCIVPSHHDGGQPWVEFFDDEDNPTTWGARKPFNRTLIVPSDGIRVVDYFLNQVVECLEQAGGRAQ